MHTIKFFLIFIFIGTAASAQVLPTANEKKAADIASYFTLGAGMALDAKSCMDSVDRKHCFEMMGIRNVVALAATQVIKKVVKRPRPCAPSECGIDSNDSDVPSGHAWFAFATMNFKENKGFAVNLSLALGTVAGRKLSNKHDKIGLAAGIAGGILNSFIR